jgi:hypothetical protein
VFDLGLSFFVLFSELLNRVDNGGLPLEQLPRLQKRVLDHRGHRSLTRRDPDLRLPVVGVGLPGHVRSRLDVLNELLFYHVLFLEGFARNALGAPVALLWMALGVGLAFLGSLVFYMSFPVLGLMFLKVGQKFREQVEELGPFVLKDGFLQLEVGVIYPESTHG